MKYVNYDNEEIMKVETSISDDNLESTCDVPAICALKEYINDKINIDFIATDDGEGNVTLTTSSNNLTSIDDGNGNITLA